MTSIAIITGNPKPRSRTHNVALAVADALAAEITPLPSRLTIDLTEHAARLFDCGRGPGHDRRLARPPARRRGAPAPGAGRAGRDRPGPRPVCDRAGASRARRRGGEMGRLGHPAHHSYAKRIKQFSRTYPPVSPAS